MTDETTAPVEEQQANVSLEESLGDAYDTMDTSDESSEHFEDQDIEEHEVEVIEETETVEASEDETVDEILEEADYNEPAPERWPEDIRSAYDALPPAGKKAMLEGIYKPMQKTYTQNTQALSQQKKALEPMLQTLERHSQEFQDAGINPAEAFNRQMAWSAHFAKVGPEQGAKDLAAAYGQGTGQQTDDKSVYMTPVEKAQQTEIDGLKGDLNTLRGNEQQRNESAQKRSVEARAQTVRDSIATFANEMRDGQPVHPHVVKLGPQMAGLIRGGLVSRTDEYGQPVPYGQQLGQAYKIACDMDPNIRGARQTQSRRKQVAKVTAASRDVVSKSSGNEVVVDDRPLSDSIGDLYDRLDRSVA